MHGQVFHESQQNHLYIAHPIKSIIVEKQTEYQHTVIADTETFGRCLFLDGILNSSEQDEFIYHEGLVHPAMVRARQREEVLIIGGAEGGTLREVLKYDDVQSVTMVDIDGELIDICREHMSDIYGDPWSDPRTNLHVTDGREFLTGNHNYDVILLDLNEPEEGNPAQGLYTKEFYQMVEDSLAPGGVVNTQAGWIHSKSHFHLTATQKSVFHAVRVLETNVPSYLMTEALNICSMSEDLLDITPGEIDNILEQKGIATGYYTGPIDKKMLTLPPYLIDRYNEVGNIRTDSNPMDINESHLIIDG